MVETGGLENRFGRKANGGSNPSPSAIPSLSPEAFRIDAGNRQRLGANWVMWESETAAENQ